MADIKTRDAIKGTIKTIDKAAIATERMKSAYAKTKDKAEQGCYADENSATEYAADRISYGADRIKDEGIHQFNKQGQKAFKETQKNIGKAKDKINAFQQKRAAKQNMAEQHGLQIRHGAASRSSASDSVQKATSQFIKTRQQGKKTVKTTARNRETAVKSATKGTVKTAEKSVKTAQTTSKIAIKTTEASAKTAKAAAKTSAKTAQKAAQAAKATARATAEATKTAVKATIAAVKAIIAGTKALISAIVAGGWVAVIIIIIICLIALLAGSVFGIFFSGEDSGNGMTMKTVVCEINTEYDTRLDEIQNSTSYDVLEMSGSRAVWKEVLAVYSVKTTTDPDNPQEVATMDDGKKQLLSNIFWEMNEISFRTENKTETVITESDDGHGNIVQTETTVTQTYLYITVSHKTADEMADQYGFDDKQRQQLAELLAEENNSLWAAVLYGINYSDDQIVTVALSQIGNVGGTPYWSWYGFGSRVEWCACFVSWCANECSYIENGVIPKFAGCVLGSQWFKDRGQWQDGSFEPSAGQIIFFDWEGDGETDHVGIVEKCENGINETDLSEEQHIYTGYIADSSEQMQQYIKILIDISKTDIGYQFHKEDIELRHFLNELKHQIEALCKTKELRLKMDIYDIIAIISADKLMLERAIMNVINNALEYSPQGGTIRIAALSNPNNFQIVITDEGEGFSQEDLLHAQEKFYMADHSRGNKLHFGMGLYITKSIIEQHNGFLSLENSKETKGAKVIISLPF